jgi:hypothetical protein
MKILIGCEESQIITKEFRKLGFEAYSCDLLPCSGGHPEWHYQCDIMEIINNGWDLAIFHPPCTFLAGSSVQWLSHPEYKHLPFEERRSHSKYPNRREDMYNSMDFVKGLYNSPIKHVAIENPVGLLNSKWRKPDQIIQPYMFGDEATKTTCLWLKNLPLLEPTKVVGKGERTVYSSGKSFPKWYAEIKDKAKTKEERQRLRSKTFPRIAEAIAKQYGDFLIKEYNLNINENRR